MKGSWGHGAALQRKVELLRSCPETGNPAAAPIPFPTVLTNQNAVFLGFGEAWGRPLVVYPRYKSNFGTAS